MAVNGATAAIAAMKGAETKKLIVIGSVVIVGGVLVYFGVINPLLQFLQIKDSKEEKKGKQAEAKISRKQTLSSAAYKKHREKVTIGSAQASKAAGQVHEGRDCCWDNEDLAVGALTSTGSKVNMSYVADKFYQLYGESMETYLDYLEPEDWTTVNNYIDKIKNW